MVITSFDQHSGILDSRFDGEVTVQEIVDYIDATRLNKSYPRVLKILTDATNAQMNFPPAEIPQIVEANYKSLEQYELIIDGIVIDTPRETALTMLYQELAATNKYRFEVFASRDAAISWLKDQ